jgi:hypothetical protein
MLPFQSLIAEHRELGLVVAVLLGFAFGFVLERAGFGRASKLAAQFYFHDMTVLKVMFSAIVTAMLGLLLFSGLGLADLKVISEGAASETFLWPMIAGGLLLGVGFIVSGYCPGTSIVAAASGNLDGLATIVGVVGGTLVWNEVYPAIEKFHLSGAKGYFFLYQWLKIPPAVLGAGVAVMAVGAFLGAEKLERIFRARRAAAATEPADPDPSPARPRRLAFGVFGALSVLILGTLALPSRPHAAAAPEARALPQAELARRVLEEPWSLRILDLRDRAACVKARVPGAECAPAESLAGLGLAYGNARRDLVLVGAGDLTETPAAALAHPGRLFKLQGGWRGWEEFALRKPTLPAAGAPPAELEAYRFRAALHAALTGMKPPPPPAPAGGGTAPRKKKGGGCSG